MVARKKLRKFAKLDETGWEVLSCRHRIAQKAVQRRAIWLCIPPSKTICLPTECSILLDRHSFTFIFGSIHNRISDKILCFWSSKQLLNSTLKVSDWESNHKYRFHHWRKAPSYLHISQEEEKLPIIKKPGCKLDKIQDINLTSFRSWIKVKVTK